MKPNLLVARALVALFSLNPISVNCLIRAGSITIGGGGGIGGCGNSTGAALPPESLLLDCCSFETQVSAW